MHQKLHLLSTHRVSKEIEIYIRLVWKIREIRDLDRGSLDQSILALKPLATFVDCPSFSSMLIRLVAKRKESYNSQQKVEIHFFKS